MLCTKTMVIKIGSSSIVDPQGAPRLSTLSKLAELCRRMHQDGHRVVIVSSGAIATGLTAMECKSRTGLDMVTKQAAAAVGQIKLMAMYDQLFRML